MRYEKLQQFLMKDYPVYAFSVLTLSAEILIAYGNVYVGVCMYLLLLLFLVAKALCQWQKPACPLYMSLIIIPLIRLISLAVPLTGIPEAIGYAAVGIPLIPAGIMLTKLLGFTPAEQGLRPGKWYILIPVSLLGVPLGFLEYFILKPAYTVKTPGDIVIWVLIFLLCTGLLEEFLFRGLLFTAVGRMLGDKKAVFVVSFLYAAMTVSGKSFLNSIYAFFVSVLFCILFRRFKSIAGLVLAHGLINITAAILCPYIFR